MLVFVAIALAAFILVTGSFLLGHDHDASHDHGDLSHDIGGEPTISIFSTKSLGTLLMGFGAAAAIAMHYGLSYIPASLIGLVCGLVLGSLMFLIQLVFYKQQASSLIPTSSAVGCTGMVTVSIGEGTTGEVSLSVEGQYATYSATSKDAGPIAKGQTVRVVKTIGSHLIVEKAA